MVDFLADKEIEAINDFDMQQFFIWLRAGYMPKRKSLSIEPLTPRSIENIWTAMRSFFNWAFSEGYVNTRPDHKVAKPKYRPRQIQPFTQEEVAAILNACQRTREADTSGRSTFTMQRPSAHRDATLVLLLLDTGIRVSECARLKIGDVNMETGAVRVEPYGTGRKTTPRTVYLGKGARRALFRYLADRDADKDDPLFVTKDDRPMDRSSILHIIVELGERAGVDNTHPHRFRHTFAVQYLRNGGDVFSLQTMLGHHSLEMVKHYLELAGSDDGTAHRTASPVDRWKF